jgi:signal transduction histidine kinase/CheY-like chemotaxis protein/HPt (histidine-containing phosphotransfer) domain-containing protein
VRSFEEKKTGFNSTTVQMMVIIIAFAIMGISSFFYVSNIERKHLINDAENVLSNTETQILAYIMEAETFLSSYAETIRGVFMRNSDPNMITDFLNAYIVDITNYGLKDKEHLVGLYCTHGYFNLNGELYINGRNMPHNDEADPRETDWYIAAIETGGSVAATEPRKDETSGIYLITFSRSIFDDNGNLLGVVALDFNLEKIYNQAIITKLTDGSYGMLLNSKLAILAHPNSLLTGRELISLPQKGIMELIEKLSQEYNVKEVRVKNYMQDDSIVFAKRIKYGWRLCIVIPVKEYYKNVNEMAIFLFFLGGILATLLCIMLYNIAMAKMKSDIKTRQKSNFLATMSHEIRTPLNAILGMTEIQMQNASHPPSTSEAFIKINNSGNLLLSIINDILDLSKIEAGKLELSPVTYEVASLINDIVQLNYIRYESKPIEFKLKIDENIPSILVGDELRIKQILNNLLSNAFKYTDQGSVTLSANAECVGRGGIVLVTLIFQVTDTGKGMTQNQINKLFDENTRFNMEANRTTEGAGLGMTITQNLLDLMHGKINVKSTVGEGTSVTVRIPQRTDGVGISGVIGRELADNLQQFRLGNAVQIKKAQVTHEHMPYGRVLIVDDVETNLYVAKGLMSPYGLQIDLATSGYEAIDRIKEGNTYDIVFMDHMMPKLDGIETTKKLREMGYTSPIVALTANALAGQAEVFMQNGFDGFISKPIDIRQLNVSLNRLIRDKQPAEVVEAAHREKAEFDKKHGTGGGQPPVPAVDSQLAAIFARDAEKAIASLDSVLQKNFKNESDIQLYIINVHSMKSALANIGEPDLSAIALRLEHAGREKDLNVMTAETRKFLDDLNAVIEKIKPKDEEIVNVEDTKEALIFLRGKLEVIKEACAAFDKKTVKNTLNELKGKTWSHSTKVLMNSLGDHLLHSEFDEIASLASSYIETIE